LWDNASSVSVAGEFNAWNKDSLHLEKNGNRWSRRIELPIEFSKHEYQFKFVVNGKDWVLNKSLPVS
jgi:1,4-alpha-glucan branching enzyme